MKNTIFDKFHFCILALGNMDEAGFISLKSIVGLEDIRICALVDVTGKRWIEQSLIRMNGSNNICYHTIDEDLNVESAEKFYSNYGTKEFASITILKWTLIRQILMLHTESRFIVFSDLDVVWRVKPSFGISFFDDKSKHAAFQDDSNQYGTKYCTGIMLWKNSEFSIDLLTKIENYNLNLINSNQNANDEFALNSWYRQNTDLNYFYTLPRHEYVIGHKIMSLLTNRLPYNCSHFIAFHANYCLGIKNKAILLNIVSNSSAKKLTKFKFLSLAMYVKLRTRYSFYFNQLKQ